MISWFSSSTTANFHEGCRHGAHFRSLLGLGYPQRKTGAITCDHAPGLAAAWQRPGLDGEPAAERLAGSGVKARPWVCRWGSPLLDVRNTCRGCFKGKPQRNQPRASSLFGTFLRVPFCTGVSHILSEKKMLAFFCVRQVVQYQKDGKVVVETFRGTLTAWWI